MGRAHQFTPSPERKGSCVIVGGSPSIDEHVEDIRALSRDGRNRILCLNAAHDWLFDHGIKPHGAVFMEVEEWPARFLQKPRRGVIYYLASCCHPTGYDRLHGYRIVQWHAQDDVGERDILGDRLLIGGGCRAGLRSIVLGGYMGFRRFEIFGMDSSFEQSTHAYDEEPDYREREITVHLGGRRFRTTEGLLRQADDFARTVEFSRGLEFRVWGDGLLRHVHKHMQPEVYH